MNPITAALIGLVAGIVIQAWRTSRALGCSLLDVLKSGGGPGWPPTKSDGGPGEEKSGGGPGWPPQK